MSSKLTHVLRTLGLTLVAIGLVPLCLAEVATRALTRPLPENGMPAFVGIPLLPHRPDVGQVRAWLVRTQGTTYLAPDPELGWTVLPSGHTPDGLYEANAQAIRGPADVVYAREPAPGKRRLIAVGDSFTHGDRVRNAETWSSRLAELRGDLEVLNLGVPAYGTDQALLRWRRDGAPFRADFVVLGIWPEDICRNLNIVRYFLQPASGFNAKPRFVAGASGLELLDSPVLAGDRLVETLTEPARAPLLAHDRWFDADAVTPKPYQRLRIVRVAETLLDLYERRAARARMYSGEDPSGIGITVAIADQFRREVAATGAQPLVLLIPMRDQLETYPDENAQPLVRVLRERGIEVIDLGPPMTQAVRERSRGCCYLGDGHLSPAGNELVARWIAERLSPRLDALAAAGRS